jgi:hypothetical protein
MKVVVISLIAFGATAGLMLLAAPEPADVPAQPSQESLQEPIRHAPRPQRMIPATVATAAPDRGAQLVREIERALVCVDPRERERAFAELLPALIAIDAHGAAGLLERSQPGTVRNEFRARLVALWVETDRAATINWITTLEDDSERRLAASDAVSHVAPSDPAAAIEISDSLNIGRDDGTLEHITQVWAEEHLEDALKWAEVRPLDSRRDQLLARIAAVEATRDPARAADLVAHEMIPGAAQRNAALAVVSQWAMYDSEAAEKWVAQFPDATLRDEGRVELARAARLREGADTSE